MNDLDDDIRSGLVTLAREMRSTPPSLDTITRLAQIEPARPRWGRRPVLIGAIGQPSSRLIRSSRLPKLVAAAVAVGIVVTAVLLVRGDHGSPAYAGWTPTSRTATTAEMIQITAACNTSNGHPTGFPSDLFDLNSYSQIRGRVALLVQSLGGGNGFYACSAEHDAALWSAVGFAARTRDINTNSPPLDDNRSPIVFGADKTTWILAGQSRTAASVELDVPGLPTATAPVIDGVYAVFWPGDPVTSIKEKPVVHLQLRLVGGNALVIDTINIDTITR